MSATNDGWTQDFEALSRQYWNAWSEMARQASQGAAGQGAQQMPGWQEAMDLWAPWARDGRTQTDGVVERMNAQTGAWFGQMQDLAKRFSGGATNASDIASAWKQAVGMENPFANPFGDMFRQMTGSGSHAMGDWMQQAAPWMEALRSGGRGMFDLPAFGLMREHQERLQALGRAQVDYQQAMSGYNAQLMESTQRAFAKFEDKLAERSEPGRQIDSTRALFDLWIDAAEEAWAEVAMTPEYRTAYGALVDAQSRMRAGVQGEVERATAAFGIPTRTEVNSSHRKVTQLERDLRDLRQRLATLEAAASAGASSPRGNGAAAAPRKAAPTRRASKPASKPASKSASRSAPASRRAK